MILGEPRWPAGRAADAAFTVHGPVADDRPQMLLSLLGKPISLAKVQPCLQQPNPHEVRIECQLDRLEVTAGLVRVTIQKQTRLIQRPRPPIQRLHLRFKLPEFVNDPVEILAAPSRDVPFPLVEPRCWNRYTTSRQIFSLGARQERKTQQKRSNCGSCLHNAHHDDGQMSLRRNRLLRPERFALNERVNELADGELFASG